jgi:hypothetical protein
MNLIFIRLLFFHAYLTAISPIRREQEPLPRDRNSILLPAAFNDFDYHTHRCLWPKTTNRLSLRRDRRICPMSWDQRQNS